MKALLIILLASALTFCQELTKEDSTAIQQINLKYKSYFENIERQWSEYMQKDPVYNQLLGQKSVYEQLLKSEVEAYLSNKKKETIKKSEGK
jgi:deoxyadenosine/deoxycytidine kinase